MPRKGTNLRFYERGSKTYASEAEARRHMADLKHRGIPSVLYETETDWKQVSPDEPLDGQMALC